MAETKFAHFLDVYYDTPFQGPILGTDAVTATSQTRLSAMLLLVSVGNCNI
jgi:hypothetical protein